MSSRRRPGPTDEHPSGLASGSRPSPGRRSEGGASARQFRGECRACRRGPGLPARRAAGLCRARVRLPAGGALILRGSNGIGQIEPVAPLCDAACPRSGPPPLGRRCRVPARCRPLSRADPLCRPSRRDETGAQPARRCWASGRRCAAARRPKSSRRLPLSPLGAVADRPCRWLSAGQRRRLALARLVAARGADLAAR